MAEADSDPDTCCFIGSPTAWNMVHAIASIRFMLWTSKGRAFRQVFFSSLLLFGSLYQQFSFFLSIPLPQFWILLLLVFFSPFSCSTSVLLVAFFFFVQCCITILHCTASIVSFYCQCSFLCSLLPNMEPPHTSIELCACCCYPGSNYYLFLPTLPPIPPSLPRQAA